MTLNRTDPTPVTQLNRWSKEPVYYMAHPVAPDDKFTYEQNMQHILDMMKFFYLECDVRVIAPYHTMCLVLPDNESEYRRIGLEVDLNVVRALGRIILVGHKISSGMKDELIAVCESYQGGIVHNFTGWKRSEIAKYFGAHREWQRTANEHRVTIERNQGRVAIGWAGNIPASAEGLALGVPSVDAPAQRST